MTSNRSVVGIAVVAAALALSGCEIRPRSDRTDLTSASATAAPVAAPLPAPVAPVASTAAPVAAPPPVAAAPVAAPKPAVTTIVVAAAPTVDPVASCRARFARECTISCNDKVNQTTTGDKRRIAHDICFGECTRAANNRCH